MLSDDRLSAISYLQWEPHGNGLAPIFCLKPLKLVFCNLKDEVPLTFQKIASGQILKGYLSIGTAFDPP
jgi:hypothetical protein